MPKPQKKQPPVKTSGYQKLNPKSSPLQNDFRALSNLTSALDTKRQRTSYDPKSGSQVKNVKSPRELQRADSVISASQLRLDKSPNFSKKGGSYVQKTTVKKKKP